MTYLISLYVWIVGGLYFGLLCLIGIFFSYFIPPESLDPFIKKMLRFLFRLIRVRVVVEGAERIDPGKTYLFMSNHVSLFDIPLLGGYIPTYVRGVEARRQFRWPVYGWAIKRMGNVPIDRKNAYSSMRSYRKTEHLIRKGRSFIILPEGHRTLDGQLRPFKRLPFHLAKQADAPIIPIGHSGLFQLKNKGSWLIHPGPVKIKFGDAIDAEKIRSLSVVELRDLVREKIQNLIE